jgi:hypothetical protein
VRLEHPGLVRQGLAQDAEHGLELVPVHRVAHQQQPLAAQPLQEVRRVEPTDLVRESASFCCGFGFGMQTYVSDGLAPGEAAVARRPAPPRVPRVRPAVRRARVRLVHVGARSRRVERPRLLVLHPLPVVHVALSGVSFTRLLVRRRGRRQ